jgi:cytochrome c556
MTLGASAHAYWGGPWGGPWGGGPWGGPWGGAPWYGSGYPYRGHEPARDRTHERQREMHDHKAAMRSVARMLSGQRTFDRAEAVGLVREIEASAGENLTRLFKPGDSRRSPLSRARVDDMDTFKASAEALKEAAGELAGELEKEPSAEDIRAGQAMSPGWDHSMRRGRGDRYSRGSGGGGAVTTEVFGAFTKLLGTCNGCHENFRTPWR